MCAALTLPGCSSGGRVLVVDVKTDLQPGVEHDAMRTTVTASSGEPVLQTTVADPGADFLRGVRAARFEGLPRGALDIEVALLSQGSVVVSRPVRVDLRGGTTGVTAVLTRTCRDVACPQPGGDPRLTACHGGRCVDPTCTEEAPDACGAPTCAGEGDCAPPSECTFGACVLGACLAPVDDDLCAPGTRCDPTVGCVADVVSDAGHPDAGLPDAGCPDAPCRLVAPQCGCGGGGCYVVDGARQCRPAGSRAAGDLCTSVTECVPGLSCVGFGGATGICQPWCAGHVDCGELACTLIGAEGVCTNDCDLATGGGCPGGASCVLIVTSGFDPDTPTSACLAPGALLEGVPCPGRGCAAGLSCVDFSGSPPRCRRLCAEGGAACPGGPCDLTSAPTVRGVRYGLCPPP